MKKDRDKLFLLHIRDAIEKIESYMKGGSRFGFAKIIKVNYQGKQKAPLRRRRGSIRNS